MIGALCSFCGDLVATLTRPWRQLFWLTVHLYISVWSVVLNWFTEVATRTLRIVTAFRREKELEIQLHDLKLDYEDATSRNAELQKKLDAYSRDRKQVIDTLDLMTGDKQKAVSTIKFLKYRVQELESENERLAENEEDLRNGLAEAVARVTAATKVFVEDKSLEYESVLVQAKDLTSKALHDPQIEENFLSNNTMKFYGTHSPSSGKITMEKDKFPLFQESEQGVAILSSVFSAMLSTLVAVIAWEAQDPCTPLVIALFIVVGMSLASVIQFFTKVQSQQGFYAVALLSLNWFVLGTLANPALPYLGQFGSAILGVVGTRFLRLFGYGTVIRVVGKVANYDLLPEL